jgi:prepilin peptidase CpaA
MNGYFIWSIALAVGVCAGWIDWRTRRIPNWLTVSGFFLALLVHSLSSGGEGVFGALKGAALALAILLPLVLLGALGAGDWKLLGTVGALLGTRMMLVVLLGAVLIAGMMGIVQVTAGRRWGAVNANIRDLLWSFYSLRWGVHPRINLDNAAMYSVPFGTATALSMFVSFAMVILN